MKSLEIIGVTISTVILAAFFYLVDFSIETDKVFLSISTFLFSIFTGFFISRQASRFNKVRETVASFDGKLTSFYRSSGHIDLKMQKESGAIITKHYTEMLESKQWDYHFSEHKTTTITSLHGLFDKYIGEEKISNLKNQSVGAMMKGLAACQDFRKQIVALREEKIPRLQWMLIYFFMIMLIITVLGIHSLGLFFGSLLKAAFIVSIASVVLILRKLDALRFSEAIMGQHSANDVVDIIAGRK